MQLSFGEIIALILYCVGFYGLLARRNMIRTIISLGIIQSAIILFFLAINHHSAMIPPIGSTSAEAVADPLPQALMITAIVIGVSVTAVSLTMFISLYHRYGSTNWKKVQRKRREES